MKESAASGRPAADHDGTVSFDSPDDAPKSLYDALFGRLAVLTGIVAQEKLDKAASQQKTAPSQSLADILVQSGTLSDSLRRAIDILLVHHFEGHNNDPQQSLSSLPASSTESLVVRWLGIDTR